MEGLAQLKDVGAGKVTEAEVDSFYVIIRLAEERAFHEPVSAWEECRDHLLEAEAVRNLSRPPNDQEREEFESAAKWLKEHSRYDPATRRLAG